MARLLSWPIAMHENMIQYYENACNYMRQRLLAGGYADIEHCLFYALPKEHVLDMQNAEQLEMGTAMDTMRDLYEALHLEWTDATTWLYLFYMMTEQGVTLARNFSF